jgi:hypothetical protein
MTMACISEHGRETFNHPGWKMLIDLALRYGWKPAGAQEPDPRGRPGEDDVFDEGDLVNQSRQPLAACEVPADHPLGQAVRSLFIPSEGPVLDSYFDNAGFRVTAGDARALAEALERALPDVPCHDALAHKTVEVAGAQGERFVPFGTPVSPFEWFGGENRAHLEAFIKFCRQGQFEIW